MKTAIAAALSCAVLLTSAPAFAQIRPNGLSLNGAAWVNGRFSNAMAIRNGTSDHGVLAPTAADGAIIVRAVTLADGTVVVLQ